MYKAKQCFRNNLTLCHAVSNEFNPHLVTVFLKGFFFSGAFVKLQKTTVIFVLSVRLSIPPAQRGFMKLYIVFFNLSGTFKCV